MEAASKERELSGDKAKRIVDDRDLYRKGTDGN